MKSSAAASARRQERPKYLYAVFLGDTRIRYLKARGQVQSRKEFCQWLEASGKSESDGYVVKKL